MPFAAQWLAYARPYRRFGQALTDQPARLGVDAVRYSFIVVDFHHLLPAGRPALLALHMDGRLGERLTVRAPEGVRLGLVERLAHGGGDVVDRTDRGRRELEKFPGVDDL